MAFMKITEHYDEKNAMKKCDICDGYNTNVKVKAHHYERKSDFAFHFHQSCLDSYELPDTSKNSEWSWEKRATVFVILSLLENEVVNKKSEIEHIQTKIEYLKSFRNFNKDFVEMLDKFLDEKKEEIIQSKMKEFSIS